MLMHPVGLRMLEARGIDIGRYVETVRSHLVFYAGKTQHSFGETLPDHNASISTGEVQTSMALSDQVRFVTVGPESNARLVLTGVTLPETMVTALVGRHVSEVVDHPSLRIPGLTIDSIHDNVDNANGGISTLVHLAPIRWTAVPRLAGETMPKMTRETCPTVHEVLVGDRRLPMNVRTPEGGALVRLMHRLRLPFDRMDARRALMRAFRPDDDGYPASPPLVTLPIDEGMRAVRLLAADGNESAIALDLRP